MENTSLHAQKVVILSRLIKESSLTLEEALLLLKEEEMTQPGSISISPNNPSSTFWINGTTPAFNISSSGNVGIGTTNPTSISNYGLDTQDTSSFTSLQSAHIADLNN